MSKSLVSTMDLNFEVVREYIHSGSSVALTTEQQDMLNKCLEAYGLIKKYPQRNVCIRQFMVTTKCAYNTAVKYVDFARQNWSAYVDVKREFLETFFLDRLLTEIASPDATEAVRSKNLATLQKYLEHMPDQHIDPKVMEQNNVNIQINIGGRNLTLKESELEAMPIEARQVLTSFLSGDIDDNTSMALLES